MVHHTKRSEGKARPGIFRAMVKDNIDKMGMGRVRVYIPAFGGEPTDENIWYTASPMSPHAGATNPYDNIKDSKKDIESQDSYGMWANGYHLENEVLVTFLNGDPGKPVLLGGLFGQNMTNSIAGYPSAKSHQGTTRSVNPPTVEYNKRDDEIQPRKPIRPQRNILTTQLKKQGLFRDMQRGQMSTSPHRDDVPQFTSMKTPRGNMFVMDDGKMASSSGAGEGGRYYARGNESQAFIRARTSRGAQIYINDNCGYVYMNSADGNSYMQIANDSISMFTKGMMTTRAKNSFSLRVDGDYNLEVLGTTNMLSNGKFGLDVGGNINLKDNGAGIAWNSLNFHSVKAEGTINRMAIGNMSITADHLIVNWANGVLLENTVCPPQPQEAQEVTTAQAGDREPEDCKDKKEVGSSLPAGSVVSPEPTGTHALSCGAPAEGADAFCNPSGEQMLSDGGTSEYPVDPPNECDPAPGEEEQPEEEKPNDEMKLVSEDPSKDVVEVVDAGPGWTKVKLADGTIELREGDRAWRNNNPGNIIAGDFANANGAIGKDAFANGHTMAVFPSREAGIQAQSNLLFGNTKQNYKDMTVSQAIATYAPSAGGNNVPAYINRVVSQTPGITANTVLKTMTPSQRLAFTNAMFGHEGNKPGKVYR